MKWFWIILPYTNFSIVAFAAVSKLFDVSCIDTETKDMRSGKFQLKISMLRTCQTVIVNDQLIWLIIYFHCLCTKRMLILVYNMINVHQYSINSTHAAHGTDGSISTECHLINEYNICIIAENQLNLSISLTSLTRNRSAATLQDHPPISAKIKQVPRVRINLTN